MKRLLILMIALILAGCGGPEQSEPPERSIETELLINGKTYTVDENVLGYTASLGDGYVYSEAISCAYDGLDKTFDYTGLGISFYTRPEGEKDMVGEVFADSLTDAMTPRGVGIGSSREEIEEVYGEPDRTTSIMHVYEVPVADAELSPASVYFQFDSAGVVVAVGITAEQLSGE